MVDVSKMYQNDLYTLDSDRIPSRPLEDIPPGQRCFPVISGDPRVAVKSAFGSDGWEFESLRAHRVSAGQRGFVCYAYADL
jgi:hypothetical protein